MPDRKPLASCPLCRGPLGQAGYVPLRGYEKDHLVRCRGCGFSFSLLEPSAEDYERVYGNYDYETEDAERTAINIANEAALAQSLSHNRKTNKVLDMAAGAGRFLERFRDLGFDCYATEFSDKMCRYLEAKGFTAYRGGLYPEGAGEDMFDIILFTEIIEHINDPLPVLAGLRRMMRPGGCLYITTPNFASLERRVIGPAWGMLAWPEHVTYWTPRHLHRALVETGLRKEALYTQNISPYRILQALKKGRLSGALSNVSEQKFSDTAQQQVAGSRLLTAVKGTVNAGLRATGLGSSLRALYRKPA